jgi:hypothetical protein
MQLGAETAWYSPRLNAGEIEVRLGWARERRQSETLRLRDRVVMAGAAMRRLERSVSRLGRLDAHLPRRLG